jgi:hypothetical protein
MELLTLPRPALADPRAIHPELAGYRVQFDAIRADAGLLADGLDEARFNWQPGPGRWSAGQGLHHLNLCGETMALPVLDRLIAEARGRGFTGQGPYLRPRLGEWFVRASAPPAEGGSLRRFKTAGRFDPAPRLGHRDIVRRFVALQDALAERVEEADGLDLGAVGARTPMLVRLTLGQWFAFVAAHERRHLWQAWQVVAALPR